ncbi:hypothetical protein FOMPIDRAFT_1023034 [Fomitopsis schrenkii]|uniref:Uncharacterized protein n=1 Tax=Fomitopsis schrenkii TaxID=2126942 RepID=S8FKW9_FOMSC|nr:hypothetical protein FOMPIDRAFT_1023034 [Fomitopsis schrenkii]
MYKLIRRISSSFFPRPDRPWSEDATSSAPQIGRKRRLSSTEPEPAPTAKKQRSESVDVSGNAEAREETPVRTGNQTEEPEVKAVTKGVKEVELEDRPAASTETAAAIPLPDSPSLQPTPETDEVKPEEKADEEEKEPVVEVSTTEQAPSASEDADAPADAVEPPAEEEKTSETEAEGEEIPGLSAVADKTTQSKDTETDVGTTGAVDAPATQPNGADKSTDDHP